MITPATSTAIGGVELNGILGGGTANEPAPPNGYITSAMLAESYALETDVQAEKSRAEAAEAALSSAWNAAYESAISYTNNAIVSESTTRAAADTAITSNIAQLSDAIANIGAGRIVSMGSISGTQVADAGNKLEVVITATLTGNTTLVLIDVAAGAEITLLLLQDGVGGHTFQLSQGAATANVPVISTASGFTIISVYSPNGTDLYVNPR